MASTNRPRMDAWVYTGRWHQAELGPTHVLLRCSRRLVNVAPQHIRDYRWRPDHSSRCHQAACMDSVEA